MTVDLYRYYVYSQAPPVWEILDTQEPCTDIFAVQNVMGTGKVPTSIRKRKVGKSTGNKNVNLVRFLVSHTGLSRLYVLFVARPPVIVSVRTSTPILINPTGAISAWNVVLDTHVWPSLISKTERNVDRIKTQLEIRRNGWWEEFLGWKRKRNDFICLFVFLLSSVYTVYLHRNRIFLFVFAFFLWHILHTYQESIFWSIFRHYRMNNVLLKTIRWCLKSYAISSCEP